MRTSWNKSLNPYMRILTYPSRGYLRIRKDISIPRPLTPPFSVFCRNSPSTPSTVPARLFFAGSSQELLSATCLILHFPGGGFGNLIEFIYLLFRISHHYHIYAHF